jgi:hypothetical protein
VLYPPHGDAAAVDVNAANGGDGGEEGRGAVNGGGVGQGCRKGGRGAAHGSGSAVVVSWVTVDQGGICEGGGFWHTTVALEVSVKRRVAL